MSRLERAQSPSVARGPSEGTGQGTGQGAGVSIWGGASEPLRVRPRRGGRLYSSRGNWRIAGLLTLMAETLIEQEANVFRANAYRRAALAVAAEPRELDVTAEPRGRHDTAEPRGRHDMAEPRGRHDMAEPRGRHDTAEPRGLMVLPPLSRPGLPATFSAAIAGAIEEIRRTGHWTQLDRLLGRHDPTRLFQGLPGVGLALAHQFQAMLGIDSLEALEAAIGDGRIARVKGLGPRRVADLSETVMMALQRGRGPSRRPVLRRPAVRDLLDAEAEFRAKARAGVLPPLGASRGPERPGLGPVLHTERGDWWLTLRYAPAIGRRRTGPLSEAVVVYFQDERQEEGQHVMLAGSKSAGDRLL